MCYSISGWKFSCVQTTSSWLTIYESEVLVTSDRTLLIICLFKFCQLFIKFYRPNMFAVDKWRNDLSFPNRILLIWGMQIPTLELHHFFKSRTYEITARVNLQRSNKMVSAHISFMHPVESKLGANARVWKWNLTERRQTFYWFSTVHILWFWIAFGAPSKWSSQTSHAAFVPLMPVLSQISQLLQPTTIPICSTPVMKAVRAERNSFISLRQATAWPPHCFFQRCPACAKEPAKIDDVQTYTLRVHNTESNLDQLS